MTQISMKSKVWRILKPMLTYDMILILVTYMGAMVFLLFTGSGSLQEKMYQTSALMTGIACLISIPLLWKQMKGDERGCLRCSGISGTSRWLRPVSF